MWRSGAGIESGGIVAGQKRRGYPAETPSRSASAWTMRTLCSLAHELGHAHYGDPPGHHGAHEIRADRFAARLLINPTEYATAEAIYGPHPAAIAAELGVTVNILKSWQQLYTALMVKSS